MIKYRVEIDNGDTFWYKWETDEYHREDGPAIIYADKDKEWWLDNKLHRKDKPACEYANGDEWWYLNGKCHREDGPAVKFANGNKHWFLNDKKLTEEEWKAKINKDDCEGKLVEIDGVEYELKKR